MNSFEERQNPSIERELEKALIQSLQEGEAIKKQSSSKESNLFVFPLLRRPFFPGMAAPLVVEPGPYYELLKQVAKSDSKTIALLMTKEDGWEISSSCLRIT